MAVPLAPLVCPVIAGRARELARIARFLEGEGGPVLLIAGEAGVGKSRLVAEAEHGAARRGMRVLRGACFEPDRALPYAPLLDLLRALSAARAPGDDDRSFLGTVAALREVLPDASVTWPAPAETPALGPEQRKRRTFDAMVDLFAELGRRGPVLLILEDLHWSDETSLEFVSHLARRLAELPIRLLLTYRSDEEHAGLAHAVAGLQRERLARELTLARLGREDAEAMVRAILGSGRPSRALLDALHRLTEGNPFFIEEILTSLHASGTASPADGLADRWTPEALPIPRTVHDAIQQRVARLGEPARQLLTLAAVAGRRFDFALLQELTRRDERQVLDLIKDLIRQHLVVEESAERFAFRHALTREAVYLDLLARERRALHQTIGEAMERLGGDARDAADLAYHFSQAGDWARTLEYSSRAGERALGMYAPVAAVDHLSQAILAAGRLTGTVPSRLHRSRGQAYDILGDFERARADFTRAAELARSSEDRRVEWQVLLDLGQLWSSRDYARTGEHIRQALEIARSLGEPAILAHTLNRLGNWHINREELSDALPYHREALAIFEQLGDRRGVAETLDVLGMTEAIGAHLGEAAAAWERAIPLLRALGDRPRLVNDLTMWMLMGGFYWADTLVPVPLDLDAAARAGEEALAIARAIGFRAGEALVLYELALWHGPKGAYAPALEAAQASLAIAEEIDHREWLVGALSSLGALHLDLLNVAAAREYGERAYALAREIRSSNWIRLSASVLAATYLQAGDLARAAAVLDRANGEDTPLDTLGQRRCWCVRGELALAAGQPARALDIANRLGAPTESGATERVAPRVAKLRGEALLALHHLDEAEAALRSARDEAAAASLGPLTWRIDAILGRLYHRRGQRLAAQQAYASARATIEQLAAGLPDDALRATFRRGALAQLPALRPPSAQRVAKAAFGGLTARERDVARRIADGKSNRAIAEDLVVGDRTVEGYVSNILDKLGFSSRAQIAGWAVAKGLTLDANK